MLLLLRRWPWHSVSTIILQFYFFTCLFSTKHFGFFLFSSFFVNVSNAIICRNILLASLYFDVFLFFRSFIRFHVNSKYCYSCFVFLFFGFHFGVFSYILHINTLYSERLNDWKCDWQFFFDSYGMLMCFCLTWTHLITDFCCLLSIYKADKFFRIPFNRQDNQMKYSILVTRNDTEICYCQIVEKNNEKIKLYVDLTCSSVFGSHSKIMTHTSCERVFVFWCINCGFFVLFKFFNRINLMKKKLIKMWLCIWFNRIRLRKNSQQIK